MKKKISASEKTVRTIAIGFMVLYLISRAEWMFCLSAALALISIFSPYLNDKIDYLWMKLAHILGLFMPKIVLGFFFYLILTPISFIARLVTRKDPLKLRKNYKSTFIEVEKTFPKDSFEKIW